MTKHLTQSENLRQLTMVEASIHRSTEGQVVSRMEVPQERSDVMEI